MRTDELSDVLSEFARTMLTDFPIQEILDHLVQRIVDIMPVSGAGVTLISARDAPRYVAASNELALCCERLQTELGEGPCLEAYHTGEAVVVPDLRRERRFPRFSPRGLDAGLGAVFTFPLRHGPAQLGALDLYCDSPGRFPRRSMDAAQTLADVAAAYVLNAETRADLQDASAKSREAARRDALTGLPNRTVILERLEHAALRGQRSGKTAALLFADLDEFKAVNDTYGHHAGDELLIAVAGRLSGVIRPGDTLARLSGDEFAILCEDLDDPSEADAIERRIAGVLRVPFVLSLANVNMQASIGIALTGRGSDAPEQLLNDADLAMYRIKHQRHASRSASERRERAL